MVLESQITRVGISKYTELNNLPLLHPRTLRYNRLNDIDIQKGLFRFTPLSQQIALQNSKKQLSNSFFTLH